MSNARFGLRVRNGLVRGITEGQQASFVDPDVSAFLMATGITDATISSALNTLVLSMKSNGTWAKQKAIYPFVGGTSITHAYNLKDISQYQITWVGGVTHSSNGIIFNGVNGYANTNLNINSVLGQNSNSFSVYVRNTILNNFSYVGGNVGSTYYLIGYEPTNNYAFYPNANLSSVLLANVASPSRMVIGSRRASNDNKLFINGAGITTSTTASLTMPNTNIFLGANSNNGTPNNFSAWQIAFTTIGDGLTDTDATNLYNAVQTFQTTLGRQV